MAGPEYLPQTPIPEQSVEVRPEQADIPAHLEQDTGVQTTQVDPQQLQDEQGQVIVQPHPAPQAATGPTITIPAHDPEELEKMSHGKPNEAQTWFGVYWLYRFKKAVHDGINAIFSQQ